MTKTDWIKVESGTMRMFCERCGGDYRPTLPCPLGMMGKMMAELQKAHRYCKPEKPVGGGK